MTCHKDSDLSPTSHGSRIGLLQKHGALRGRKVERVTFTEITKQAVTKALESPRQVRAVGVGTGGLRGHQEG